MFSRHKQLLGDCFDKVKHSKVMIAGVGGLGSFTADLLVRIGIGTLYLVDSKEIDLPDLNRQTLYKKYHIGRKKVLVAKEELLKIRENVKIFSIPKRIDEDFKLPNVEVVLDCLDNFESRYVLSKKAYDMGVPFIHAGVREFYGQITVIYPGKTKSFEKIFGKIDDNDDKPIQIFPPVVSLVSSIIVSEAVKILCKEFDDTLLNKLLLINIRTNSFDIINL